MDGYEHYALAVACPVSEDQSVDAFHRIYRTAMAAALMWRVPPVLTGSPWPG